MYDLAAHGLMIANTPRMDAYVAAIEASLRPGDVVLDLGAGTGIFGLIACRLGASRVYAVEPDASIAIAELLAQANGLSNRMRLIRAVSTAIDLPERVDLVVGDLRGVMPFFGANLVAMADARERFLEPGGRVIPLRDRIFAAVVECPKEYAHFDQPWSSSIRGIDLSSVLPIATDAWRPADFTERQLLSAPEAWTTIDYATVSTPSFHGPIKLVVTRPGIAHGVGAWFDTELAPGIGISGGPGNPRLVYRHAFFPFRAPVQVREHDVLDIGLSATYDGSKYQWGWNTIVTDRAGTVKARFRQSTLGTACLGRRTAGGATPLRSESAHIDSVILGAFDGACTIDAIARRVSEMFPARFPRWEAAVPHIWAIAERYAGADIVVAVRDERT